MQEPVLVIHETYFGVDYQVLNVEVHALFSWEEPWLFDLWVEVDVPFFNSWNVHVNVLVSWWLSVERYIDVSEIKRRILVFEIAENNVPTQHFKQQAELVVFLKLIDTQIDRQIVRQEYLKCIEYMLKCVLMNSQSHTCRSACDISYLWSFLRQ